MTTVFTPTSNDFTGVGTNIWVTDQRLNEELAGLNFSSARVWIDTEDPGKNAIWWDDVGMEALWKNSSKITSGATLKASRVLADHGILPVYTIGNAPLSWLSTDGNRTLSGDAVVAFARYWVAGIKILQGLGIKVPWIEPTNEPSGWWTMYVSPKDYVWMVESIRSIARARGVTGFKIMGPGLPNTLGTWETNEPWTEAFSVNPSLLDAWSIHVYEKDAVNDGTLKSRCHVGNQLGKNMEIFKRVNPKLQVWVTEFATKATKFTAGIDYGERAAPDTVEYAVRLADNFCGIAKCGVVNAQMWQLATQSWDPNNTMALYRVDGSVRPQHEMFQMLDKTFPVPGKIFVDQGLPAGDETLKTCIVSGNLFGIVLSRGQKTDALQGSANLVIQNPAWSNATSVADLDVYVFPSSTVVQVIKAGTASSGQVKLSLANMPYGSVVYVTGRVVTGTTPTPPPAPTPVPAPTPTVPTISIKIPTYNGTTGLPTVKENDIYYDTVTKTLQVYKNGRWTKAQVVGS